MPKQRTQLSVVLKTLLIMCAAIAPMAHADDDGPVVRRYAVTITNIMHGQNLAPPSIIAHNSEYKLFSLGGTATPGLTALAETPSGALLLSEASALPSVYSTALSNAVIPPGGSQTLYIETTKEFSELTVATMLATSNDAFMAARNIPLPRKGSIVVEADAYDAGTEANSTSCAYVFGPPCNDLRHNPARAEGFIHIHPGVPVGSGGFDPLIHDWRNPVTQIEIKRVN